jgi:hypothetical protein
MSKILNQNSKSNSPKTITTDWAQFSLTGEIPQQQKGIRQLGDGWTIRYYGYGHGIWETMADVFKDGLKVGKIDCHPKQLQSRDRIIFYTSNLLQYQKGWTLIVKEFINKMNLKFNHVGRVDIAIDRPASDGFKFIEKVGSRKWRPTGGADFDFKMRNGQYIYARYGSRKSGRCLKFYYKRQEILNVSNKHYIEEFWAANFFNLDDSEEVERFELTLKREELKKYVDLIEDGGGQITLANLHALEDPEFLSTLYQTATDSYLEFVSEKELSKKGNVSRCRRHKIIDFSGFIANLLLRVRSKTTTDIYAFKMSIKKTYQCYLKTGSEIYLAIAKEMTKNCNLDRWFIGNESKWYKDFCLKYRSKDFEYLTNYELEDVGQLRVVKLSAYL